MADQTPKSIHELAATSVQKIQRRDCSGSPERQQQNLHELDITTRENNLMMILNSELKPMFSIYCVDYAARFGEHSDDVMREYARLLIHYRIGRKGLQRGINRLRLRAAESKFTPNPAEFAELCKPTIEELGIPDLETATYEVREARTAWRHKKAPYPFSHDVCRYINLRVGYDIHQTSDAEWRQRVSREYHYLVKQAIAGQLPSFRNALPHKEPEDDRPTYEQWGYKTLSREEARAVIDSLLKRKRADNTDRGRVDTSRRGPGIAGSSNASTSAERMTGSKPE